MTSKSEDARSEIVEPLEKTSSFRSRPLTHSPAIKPKDPRTAIGMAIATKNALKRGIFSNAVLLTSESREEYDSILSGLCENFKPTGALEEVLVEKLAVLIWRYRRLIMTETAEIKAGAPIGV